MNIHDRHAAAHSGRWRRNCSRRHKSCSDLNSQPKRPGDDLDLWPFDLESGVRVKCDVGYLCANFGLPRPLCSRLWPNGRDRQTDVRQKHRLRPPPIRGGGIIIWIWKCTMCWISFGVTFISLCKFSHYDQTDCIWAPLLFFFFHRFFLSIVLVRLISYRLAVWFSFWLIF